MYETEEGWLKLAERPSWSMLVVGCGGGPLEDDLSCYYVKPFARRWQEDGCFAIEGGSGLGALNRLVQQQRQLFSDFALPEGASSVIKAGIVADLVKAYVISHSHLDHIAGLVLSAGSTAKSKRIFGTAKTIENLQHVFDGGVWPALASFEEGKLPYVYRLIETEPQTFEPYPDVVGTAHRICHGTCGGQSDKPYDSTAFFFRLTSSSADKQREFLFFGDVGPDSLSVGSHNRSVWRKAAERIVAGTLATIFIECSYFSNRPDDNLYGHLTPRYLFEELHVLATCIKDVSTPQASTTNILAGINVCIMHMKDEISSDRSSATSARDVIRREILDLEQRHNLGSRFVFLEQGMRVDF